MAKNDRFIRTHNQGVANITEIWVDTETGVNYVYHLSGYAGGLCPLYDAEGKVVVTPIKGRRRALQPKIRYRHSFKK